MTAAGDHPVLDILVDVPIVYDVDGGTTVHSPMVHAVVGGVPTRLILDTGSTDHVLTKELIDRVGATLSPGEDGTDHAGAPVPSWLVGAHSRCGRPSPSTGHRPSSAGASAAS